MLYTASKMIQRTLLLSRAIPVNETAMAQEKYSALAPERVGRARAGEAVRRGGIFKEVVGTTSLESRELLE